MKKILIVLLLLIPLIIGCSKEKTTENNINQKDIEGYWVQVESNWSGDITDLSENRYAYLEITDENLYYYTISFDENEGYTEARKYYKLDNDKIYYDYYELKGNNWKDNIDEAYGGIIMPSVSNSKLVLTEYSNNKNKDDGYTIDTYEKVESKDWPIEE